MLGPEDYLARAALADNYARLAMSRDLRIGFLNVAERWRRLADIAEIADITPSPAPNQLELGPISYLNSRLSTALRPRLCYVQTRPGRRPASPW